MKKIVLLLCMLSVCSLFISCGKNENTDDSDVIESGILDYEDTFTTIDELGKFIIKNKESYFKNLFEHPTMKNNDSVLTLYELADVPGDFYLSEIRKVSYSINISTCYKNDSTNEQITFAWYFTANGDEYLNNCKAGYTEIPEMPGYYSLAVSDENNIDIYQILWSEDGYCFQLNIPVRIFEEKLKEKEFINLKKVEFPVEI